MTKAEFVATLNEWGRKRLPFLFIADFELENPHAFLLENLPQNISFNIRGVGKHIDKTSARPSIVKLDPIDFTAYNEKFSKVFHHLAIGDSYLTNLTCKTKVSLSNPLEDIFHASSAPYKLLVENEFLVFSPECFVRIEDGKIFSYPMKGTIDAAIPNAKEKILNDAKELAEHVTIVDLIRNDLSIISTNVEVTRFRYVEEIKTKSKSLLQVSSEIKGDLPTDWTNSVGDILISLLPAGSISGAPKPKTVEIIQNAEQEKRGYYTGVFGYFDGSFLDSAVMIRFIEQHGNEYFYRSGGGITTQSVAESEYQEMIDKVYVPID